MSRTRKLKRTRQKSLIAGTDISLEVRQIYLQKSVAYLIVSGLFGPLMCAILSYQLWPKLGFNTLLPVIAYVAFYVWALFAPFNGSKPMRNHTDVSNALAIVAFLIVNALVPQPAFGSGLLALTLVLIFFLAVLFIDLNAKRRMEGLPQNQ